MLALVAQLASDGFTVTTVEPACGGLGGIPFLIKVFAEFPRTKGLKFRLIAAPIKDRKFERKLNFFFSVTIIEHLENPYSVLIQLVGILGEEGEYPFFCPNYDFP